MQLQLQVLEQLQSNVLDLQAKAGDQQYCSSAPSCPQGLQLCTLEQQHRQEQQKAGQQQQKQQQEEGLAAGGQTEQQEQPQPQQQQQEQQQKLKPPEKVLLPSGGLKQLNYIVCERRGWPVEVCQHRVGKRKHEQFGTPVIEYWLPCASVVPPANCGGPPYNMHVGSSSSGTGAVNVLCYEGYKLGASLPRVSASLLALGRLKVNRSKAVMVQAGRTKSSQVRSSCEVVCGVGAIVQLKWKTCWRSVQCG